MSYFSRRIEKIRTKDSEPFFVSLSLYFSDPLEAQKVIELIQSLTGIYRDPEGKFMLSNAGEPRPRQWVSASDIAVISPFREQVWRLRLALRKIGLSTVNVGTTEVFQGAEHLVTIISTVRTRERFLKDDMKNSLGLIYERKRFCVATTRAQELLIVVGNPQLLKVDPYWRSFWNWSLDRKLIEEFRLIESIRFLLQTFRFWKVKKLEEEVLRVSMHLRLLLVELLLKLWKRSCE